MPLAEIATNNIVNMATGYSPFFLNLGDHPIVPTLLLQGHGTSQVEAVQLMVEWMKTALEEAQANLAHAQRRAQYQANKDRKSVV